MRIDSSAVQFRRRRCAKYLSLVAILTIAGFCSCTRTPVAVKPAEIDADAAAVGMLQQFDVDTSGSIDLHEAGACPGLPLHFSKYDGDGDGEIRQNEIAERFRGWSSDGAGVLRVGCRVTLDGRPLPKVHVALEPQSFFGDALKPAAGITSESGQCSLSISPEDLPPELKRVRGVQPGLYLVHIMSSKVDIPPRYNSQTELGLEVAADSIGPEGVELALTSR